MAARRLSNVVGFDDAPFQRGAEAPVTLVGAVCAATRLHIVLRAELQQDGNDATQVLAQVTRQPELSHVRAVLLKGITMAGFNVVDIHALSEAASLPVLVVCEDHPTSKNSTKLWLTCRTTPLGASWWNRRARSSAAGRSGCSAPGSP
jgi:uncharacterized protein